MKIINATVSNYRNLDGLEVSFDGSANFLVGENELGKSNLLDIFDIVFNHRRFLNDDFSEPNTPIEINLSIKLSETEQGNFEDYFSPDKNNLIKIKAIQEYSNYDDQEIKFFWIRDTLPLLEIKRHHLRKVNYIAYNSLKTPQDELNFHKGRGSGKFLSYLITEFAKHDEQLDISEAVNTSAIGIRDDLNRIKIFRQQQLSVSTGTENVSDFLARILMVTGKDGLDIQKSGFGTQFSTMLILSILERLVYLYQRQDFKPFEENREFFTHEEYEVFSEMYLDNDKEEKVKKILAPVTRQEQGRHYIDIKQLKDNELIELGEKIVIHIKIRKSISLVLGLDEPEIHLHPYMQRYLVKYILELLNNQDGDFLFLLKKYFDVDALDGQMLLVSHSPTVILDEYKQVVRFYGKNGVKAVSGSDLKLDDSDEKHLLMNFPYIKEAFFSRCAVVSEGQTEAGALPLWANKIIGDVDEHGIVFINAGGKKSAPPVVRLLNRFMIPNVCIVDKDDDSKKVSEAGMRTTNLRDFEEELFEAVYQKDKNVTELFRFLEEYGENGLSRYTQTKYMDETAKTYNITIKWDTCVKR